MKVLPPITRLLAFLLLAPWVWSQTTTAEGLVYTSNGAAITITGYTGTATTVTIPAAIGGVPVRVIGTGAFLDNTRITSVIVPEGVTTFGNYVFQACSNLTTVSLPSSLTSVGYSTFERAAALTTVNIPAGLTRLGDYMFADCVALTSISLPATITAIGMQTFRGCTGLTTFHFPAGVASLISDSFAGCTNLRTFTVDSGNPAFAGLDGVLFNKNLTELIKFPQPRSGAYSVPSGVTKLAANAFNGAAGLTTLALPASLTIVAKGAIINTPALTAISVAAESTSFSTIGGILYNKAQTELVRCPQAFSGSHVIPQGVVKIVDGAFIYCGGLTGLTMPNTVTTIEANAFQGCTALPSLALSTALTSIGDWAFGACVGLRSIAIPAGVTSIGPSAFQWCGSLGTVIFQGAPPTLTAGIFGGTGISKVYYRAGASGWAASFDGLPAESVATSGTTSAGLAYALVADGYAITAYSGTGGAVTIPAAIGGVPVTRIGNSAFKDKTTLTGITFPASVTTIDSYAFAGCSSLATLTLPSGLQVLEGFAFSFCSSLTTVTIPASVITIGRGPFTGCLALTNLTVAAGNANYASTSDGAFILSKDGLTLVQGAPGRSGSITVPATVTHLASNAFDNCQKLTAITLPAGLKSIGAGVFSACVRITSLALPEGLTSIGEGAFINCVTLATINLPSTLTFLDGAAFQYCYSLKSIVLPSSLTEIKPWTFYLAGLSSITLPTSLTRIELAAFNGCNSLQSIVIPAGVTMLGDIVFKGCTALTTVAFLGNAPTIGADLFAGSGVTSVHYVSGKSGWTATFSGLPTSVLANPTITTQPATLAVAPGGTVTFSVAAAGIGPFTYQWSRNGLAVGGATNAALTVTNVQLAQAGRYHVTVSNAAGSVLSGSAWLHLTGRAWAVGLNNWGQLGDEIPLLSPSFVPVASRVRQVALGSTMALIRDDDTLWISGYNQYGKLGLGDIWPRGRPIQVASGVADVSIGGQVLTFVKRDGTLWGAGLLTQETFAPIQIASGVRTVSAGGAHTLYLTVTNELWGFGANSNGQLGDGTTTRRDTPVRIATGVMAAAAGTEHSLFIKSDGTVWSMGRNHLGQLGDGTTTNRLSPVQIATNGQFVSSHAYHSLLVSNTGALLAWGEDAGWARKLGLPSSAPVLTPTLVTQGVTAVATGGNHSLFRKTDGSLWGMGFRYYGSLGDGATNTGPTPTGLPVKLVDGVNGPIAAGGEASAYVTATGELWVAGADHWGQLGRGRQGIRLTPVPMGGPASAAQVSAGGTHTLLVAADGGLWATGSNVYWSTELGDGTDQSKATPVKVAEQVSFAWAGYSNSFFLKSDRTLWGMGFNPSGALGNGTTVARSLPGQIASGVSTAAPGEAHLLYVTDEGILMATGRNQRGQLGDGTTTDRLVPVPVASGVVAVAAGSNHSLFIKQDGTLWGMGQNGSGELGDGTNAHRATPVQILTNVASVAAGAAHSLVLKRDGTLWGFGSNSGTLGDGTMTGRLSPVQIASDVVAIAAADNNSRFLKADGSLWGMGNNWNGQLADPLSGVRTTPVRLAGKVVGITMGYNHTAFVQQVAAGLPPILLSGPGPVSGALGQSAAFAVVAEGEGPLGFQWFRDGVALPGAKDPVLILPFTRLSDRGTYTVTVTNSGGSVTSNAAVLALTTPPAVERGLIQGAVRAANGAGATALLGSFTIEGTVAKQMLLRGVGPGLTTFGVSGVLADPRLEVVHAGTGLVVATNDDWGTAANAAQAALATAQVGAFPLGTGSRDAALLGTFGPGTYRVQVRGADATPGLCLLEIYDADTTPRLVQLAVRAPVGGSAGALIQGFVTTTVPAGRSYLIRALGASLGLAGALADPVVTLFNATGATLATNDNWGGDTALATAAVTAGAMPLDPAGKDAALLFTPPAAGGGFTLQVTGAAGSSGVALLEVFEVDTQRPAGFAPALVAPPESTAVAIGQPVTLGVIATGKPAPTFQWRKDGLGLPGATQARFTLAAATATDAGGYEVVVTNPSGAITSPVATVTVSGGAAASHSVVGGGYVAGGTVTITNTLTYAGSASSLGWQVTLPAGWSFAADGGSAGDVKPTAGTTGTLEWAWSTVPASPVTFTYTVNVPAGETEPRSVTASGIVRAGGAVTTVTATPSPLPVALLVTHSADVDRNYRISLLELTRVIELYNTRNGTSRTGAYAVTAAVTEDGFEPAPARLASAVVTLTRYHSGDSSRDGKLGLLELTRVIELYNYRSGTTRTGQYKVKAGTEDGFDPGP